MRTFTVFCAAFALVAPAVFAASSEAKVSVATVKEQLGSARDMREMFRRFQPTMTRDVRGRTKFDDLEQWAYTDDVDRRVASLLKDARRGKSPEQQAALEEASGLLRGAQLRAIEIANYWSHKQAIRWREDWKRFATANGLPGDAPNAQLAAEEQAMIDLLNAGKFSEAVTRTRELESGLRDAIRSASTELVKTRPAAGLAFVPRKLPCPVTDGRRGTTAAKISVAASPDDFYPPGSVRREEQGDIIVRVRVEPSNCATGFALLVSSGYPELDQAALAVAEASRYLAAVAGEKAVDSEVTFKVRFSIKPY
ncbi:MAG: energy transducer TonB [Pseudomonadota bacterium]